MAATVGAGLGSEIARPRRRARTSTRVRGRVVVAICLRMAQGAEPLAPRRPARRTTFGDGRRRVRGVLHTQGRYRVREPVVRARLCPQEHIRQELTLETR